MSLVFDDRNIASFHLPISLFEIFLPLTSSILILEIIFNVQFSRYHLNRNSFISIQWRQRDSNSRPPACKAGALPTELCPLTGNYAIVGALFWLSPSASGFHPMGLSGLEPPTSRLSGVRSNQLSYKPILKLSCSLPVVSERLKNIFVHFQWTHYFYSLAATYSPVPSPVKYHRPLRS